MSCHLRRLVEWGDHVLGLGHVKGVHAAQGAPTYFGRSFGTHQAVPG